jgi:serpin B
MSKERWKEMKRLSLISLAALLLALPLLGACAPGVIEGVSTPDQGGVVEPRPTEGPALAEAMSEEEARDIAASSECGKAGALLEDAFYNDGTGTWWIDLDAEKEGCSPACVVNVRTGEAEINWRCTGAIPGTPTPTPTEVAAEVPATEQPAQVPTPTPMEATMREIAQSEKQRATSPNVSASDLADLVNGNSGFAFDLYQFLREQEGNLFYSPYSISLALAMTYAGARGETQAQMADTLHFALSQERLHPAFNGLDIELARRGEGAQGKDEKGFRLNIVNAIWGQEGFEFLPQFLDALAENYGAGLRLLDFALASEEARVTINDWVSDQTEGRIEDLIPQGVIDRLTRLVLTNAIYFNAAWLYPFQEQWTQDGTFHLLDGGEVTVPMMPQTESFRYAEGEEYQAVELPYDGRELSMVILLPRDGRFDEFQSSVGSELAGGILGDLGQKQVALTMPRFEFESDFSLAKALMAMGMPLAFTGDADFSGMTGSRHLFISDVIHKAFVSLDEAGTEAAAATAVAMKLMAVPEEPVEVTVDRPFIFLIRDIETGTILFVGRVVDPRA